jgi:hypothetical protein
MSRRAVVKGLLAFAVAGNLVCLVAPAGATPPEHHTETIFEHEHFSCPNGVELDEQGPVLTLNGITYFDRTGNPVRDIEQATFDGIITNTRTGEQFRDREHSTFIFDFIANTFTIDGQSFQFHPLDGGPVLVLDVGHIVFDINSADFISGSDMHFVFGVPEGLNTSVAEAICPILAP